MSRFARADDETYFDPSGLKDRSIRTREQANAAEARNIARPMLKYLLGHPSRRIAPFDFNWVIQLHAEMFGDVWDWAGRFRDAPLNIGVSPSQIVERLSRLVDDLPEWGTFGIPLLSQSAMLHHRAVEIHPFPNGNGRWSRLLANIWLKQNRHPIVHWPEGQIIGSASSIRAEYISAIKQSDVGDYAALELLQTRFLQPRQSPDLPSA